METGLSPSSHNVISTSMTPSPGALSFGGDSVLILHGREKTPRPPVTSSRSPLSSPSGLLRDRRAELSGHIATSLPLTAPTPSSPNLYSLTRTSLSSR